MTMPKHEKARPRQRLTRKSPVDGAAPALSPGPRKQRRPGPPPPRHTLHKARAAWFRARVSWPMREAPVEKLAFERRRAARTLPVAKLAAKWRLAGPTNIGGRCTALVCDPGDAD